MRNFSNRNSRFFCILFFVVVAICFCSCKSKLEYFNYVSELRSNIFLAQNEDFSLRIYAVEKENPYAPDGIKKETSHRTEVYLVAPSGEKNCELSFSVDGKNYGGEMSFDNVRAEYYYSCTLDISALTELPCEITYGESQLTLTAHSVKTPSVISPYNLLQTLIQTETELFSSLTDKYGFAGEIYIRLLYEDSPYYYVGVMDRNGNAHAFLINAQTGKILAKRQAD